MCKPLLASINSPRLCGHSVGLVCICDSRVVYSLFLYHQKNLGGPGSSRGMLERIRVGLTRYRSPASVAWPLSHQLRFEHTLGPIFEEKLRSKILVRNLLAEAVCV